MAITIRAASPTSEAARALIAALSAEMGALYDDDGSGAFTPDDVLVERAVFLIAWDGDEAVGCGALRPMDDATIGEIKRMYVASAARGQGVARQLLAKLEAMAVEYDYRELCLETGIKQPAAIRLYERAGYAAMDCYGKYRTDPMSLCYRKLLV